MALVVHLKKDQQVVINGAVIENTSGRTVTLKVKNEAAILRAADVLAPEAAATPATRVYYALQCLYLFPDRAGRYLEVFHDLIESYGHAAPSARAIVAEIGAAVQATRYYAALKHTQRLIDHEGKALAHAEQQLSQELRRAAGAGQPARNGGVGADQAGLADEG
ncbi:MAG: flagellum biosynthesis protein FlbT [Rhodospirillales bacterium]|nr:flagellum biosynthesis protein FlbT [Rhodospirillales bacterium]